MLIDDSIMIAGMDSKTLNIRAYVSPDETSSLRGSKLLGPLIWPAYLFVELINIKLDNKAVENGDIMTYKRGTYFVNINEQVESNFNKYGKAALRFSPLGHTIEINNFAKMDLSNKLYRHFLGKCMEDVKDTWKLSNSRLDKRKSLNTFLDEYRHLLPECDGGGELFDRITRLEDRLRSGPARI